VGAAVVTVRFAFDDSVRAADLGPNPWLLFSLLLALVAAAWSMGLFRRTQLAYGRLLEERARQAADKAVLDERARIAREIHDVVAHSLSVMVNQAKGGQYASDQAAEALVVIEDTGRQALNDMRSLLGVLRTDPADHAPQPTLRELPDLLDRVRSTGLAVHQVEHGTARQLGPAVGLTAYRVIQEALTNAVKHAGPATAVVTLDWEPEALRVTVTDDGTGPGTKHGAGHGLVGMRERVAAIGGTVCAGPSAGGFRVTARIPYPVENQT
jgi:signal transduction histidine kinase